MSIRWPLRLSSIRECLRCAHADVEQDNDSLNIRWIQGPTLRLSLAQCRGATVDQAEDGTCELLLTFAGAPNDPADTWKDRITVNLSVPEARILDAREFAALLTRRLRLQDPPQRAEPAPPDHDPQPVHGSSPHEEAPALPPVPLAAPDGVVPARPGAVDHPLFARIPRSEEWVNLAGDRDCAELYDEVLERLRLSG